MYNVCHKCGLPRAREKGDVDLGGCICMGQTWFPFEETLRTEQEARDIATGRYNAFKELYARQNREQYSYDELDSQYRKAVASASGR